MSRLILVLTILLASATATAQIKLGIIVPLTGPVASMGQSIKGAFSTYKAKNLVYEFEDDQCDAKKALAAYYKLSAQGVKVFFVACSGSILALAPLAKSNGDLIVSSYAGSAEIRKTGIEVIRFDPDAVSVSEAMNEYLKNSAGPYALWYEAKDYSVSLAELISEKFKDQIVFEDSYNGADASFKSQITRLSHSSAKSLIFIPVSDTAAAIIFKEMRELGFNKPIIGDVNVCDYNVKPSDFGLSGVCFLAFNEGEKYEKFRKDFEIQNGSPSQYPFYDAITFDIAKIFDDYFANQNASVADLQQYLLKGVQGSINYYSLTPEGELKDGGKFIKLIEFKAKS